MSWESPTRTADYIREAGYEEREICMAVAGKAVVSALTRRQRQLCFDEVERRARAERSDVTWAP
jgi:hypothetical protein